MSNGRGRDLMVVENVSGGLSGWIPFFVVTGVVTGFIALAWYAYHTGMQSLREEDLLVVEADKTPLKEKPVDPGGMQFPNQDKTIFDTFAGKAQQQPKVERVLPTPEEPMPKNVDMSETTSWINDSLRKDGKNAVPAPATEQMFGNEDKKPHENVVDHKFVPDKPESHDDQSETYIAPKPEAPPVPITPIKAVEKPAEKPMDIVTKPRPSASVFDHAPPKVSVVSTGAYKVQLGAYRSEAEARDNWNRIQKKHAELSGKEPQIAKADLGAKGIYYRLRVDGLGTEAEAKKLCSALTAKGQACILPVGK